ncbi:MAG: hypothetical protein ACNA8W_17900 [Bradymonadaceae bacterium]
MFNTFHATNDYVAYFVEFPASIFTSVSGGESTNEVTQQFGGGAKSPTNIVGPTTVSAVTLQKPYDHVKDAPLDIWASAWDKGIRRQLTLIVQPLTSEGIPVGKARTYLACAKTSYRHPDVNAGSAETAMLDVTVQPERKE